MERRTTESKRSNRCRSRNTFITTSIIFSLLFVFSVNAWWDIAYPFRYPIYNNHTTTEYTLSVNDNKLVGGNQIIWSSLINDSYIYCEQSGCSSGLIAIANETNEKNWENESSKTGNNPTEIWKDYVAIYHLTEADSIDSTLRSNGTAGGDPTVVAGLFGNGLEMDGTGDYVDINNIVNYFTDHGDFTVEFWVKPTREWNSTTGQMGMGSHAGGRADIWYNSHNGAISMLSYDGANPHTIYYTMDFLKDTWYYIVFTFDSGTGDAKIYINGEWKVTEASFDWENNPTSRASIGGDYDGNPSSYGVYDEYRFSNVTRDLDYIQTNYYNGIGNMTTLGAEEPAPQWQDIVENTADPTTYSPTPNYGFQVNCTDESGITNVFFEHNVTGSLANITCSNDTTDIFYANITSIGAGVLSYSFICNDTSGSQNRTDYNTFTVNKGSSELTLTASPSWTVAEGTQTNVTCYAIGDEILLKDGVVVTDEYVSTLSYGTYNFTCYIPLTGNYTDATTQNILTVGSTTYGCTNTDTYAFSKTITATGTSMNLNFTNLIDLNYVNENLTDVWVNSSVVSDAWINQTDMGNILVVNTTGVTTFDVRFGNYIGDQNYTDIAINFTSDNVSMTGYSEINPYYVLTFYEESNNTNQLPPSDNITLMLYCPGGTSNIDINNDKILVSAVEQLDEMKVKVGYDDTFYYRNLLVSSTVEFRKFFLVDFTENDLVKMTMTLEDYTSDYGEGVLKIKKSIEDTLETVTELNFDAENKAIIYLIDGDKYTIEVHSSEIDASRSIGYLYVDADDTTKTIIIGHLTTVESLSSGNVYLNLSIGSIDLVWNDTSNTTSLVELWAYNYTEGNDTLLYHDSCSNSSFCSFTYDTPDNATYRVKYEITQTDYPSWGATVILSGEGTRIIPTGFPIGTLISELGGDTLVWIPLLLVLPIGLLFGRNSAGIGSIVMFLSVLLLDYWGIFTVPTIIKAVAGFISVIVFILRIRRDVV